jgi:LmbE family N-acetylglucosaminyl deacetylase
MKEETLENGKKKVAMIIIPHVDDELFSCWSILTDKSYDKIIIVRCTTGDAQEARLKIYDELRNSPDKKDWLNSNIVFVNLFKVLATDGRFSSEYAESVVVTALDRVLQSEPITDLFYPASSHHQDHHYLNRCVRAAIRVRSSLKIKSIYEYVYAYHQLDESGSVYHPMTAEQLNQLMWVLERIHLEYCPILDDDSITSLKVVRADAERYGRIINVEAADRFIPIRVTHE